MSSCTGRRGDGAAAVATTPHQSAHPRRREPGGRDRRLRILRVHRPPWPRGDRWRAGSGVAVLHRRHDAAGRRGHRARGPMDGPSRFARAERGRSARPSSRARATGRSGDHLDDRMDPGQPRVGHRGAGPHRNALVAALLPHAARHDADRRLHHRVVHLPRGRTDMAPRAPGLLSARRSQRGAGRAPPEREGPAARGLPVGRSGPTDLDGHPDVEPGVTHGRRRP